MSDIELLEAETPDAADAAPAATAPAAAPATDAAPAIAYPDEPAEGEESAAPSATAAAEAKTTEQAAEGAPEAEAAPSPGRHGPLALTKMIGENEALKGFLDDNPRAKSQLYQFARRSGELSEYQQLLPTLTRAKQAVESQTQLQELDRLYLEGSPQDFLARLWEAQATTDPLNGQRISSGVYERHVQFLHGLMLEALGQQAAEADDAKLQSAVETIREALGVTRPSPATGGSLPDLPPSIRRRLAEAERAQAELADLRLRRSEEMAERQEQFKEEIVRETADRLDEFVRGLLANTGLNEYTQRAVARDFIERAAELADRDPVHAASMEELFYEGASPATRERLVGKALAWSRQHAREILEPIVRGAAEAARREQVERESARAARLRPEPAGAGSPAPPARPSVRDLIARRESSLRRRLSDREILDL